MKSQSLWSSTPAWRLPICKAPPPISAWRLSIYKAPSPRHVRGSSSFPHGAPCVHQVSRNYNFPHQRGVSKETWRALISPLEMTNFHTKTDDAHFASRSAQRRWSFPSTCKFSFLLSFQSTGLLPGLQSSKLQPRANQTTAHDETSRARRHEGRTAPYQSTARRLHRLARTADMWPCSLPLGDFFHFGNRNLSKFTTSKMDFLSVTPKVTSYYSHTKTSAIQKAFFLDS